MPSSIVGTTTARLETAATRPRRTARPARPFQQLLRTGADVLLAGAGAASGLVGGPLLSAAIGAARSGLARSGQAGASGQSTGGSSPLGYTGSGGQTSEIDAMRQLQQESQQANLQYLQLQQDMQQTNRRFSLASSVLKAKHDTARSAINNLRV